MSQLVRGIRQADTASLPAPNMKSCAVSLLLLFGVLGYCSGASNGTGTTPETPTTKGNVLTTVMNNTESQNDTEPTTNGTTAQMPTDQPNITEKTVTTTEGSNITSMVMTTAMSSGNTTTNGSTSVMSTMFTQPTTPHPQTTSTVHSTPTMQTMPTHGMSWKVMNDNMTCQLMRFAQNITIKYYNTKGMLTDVNVSVPLKEPLSNVTGDCSSTEKRTFAINFYPDSNSSGDPWTLRFVFKTVTLNAFHLTSLSLEMKYDDRFNTTKEGQFSYSYSSTENPLGGVGAPIGTTFSCESQLISSGDEKVGLSIVFEDVKLQPFADKAQGQFGESVQCPYKPDIPTTEQSNTWKVAFIVVSIIFGVFFLGTGGFCYYVKKHHSSSNGDTYSLMETY